jgi:DmsE family decaheme c-type cytochrome
MRLRSLLWASLAGIALLATVAIRRPDSEPAAHYVGSQACADCHEKQSKEFATAGHGRAEADSMLVDSKTGCESCHGPGSLHVEAGGDKSNPGYATIIDLRKLPAQQVVDKCLTCHTGGDQFLWADSKHADSGVSCISCHSIHDPLDPGHKSLLRQANVSQLCLTCHKSKKLALARSAHMPIEEGSMNCASCHNPHGSSAPNQLRYSSNNELCESCHTDKRGPMLWEHAPVRENCVTCHEPHGSNNDKVLAGKRPFLCQRCHVSTRHPSTLYDNPDLASNRLFNRSCTNCHSQIHGSNHPSGQYLLR